MNPWSRIKSIVNNYHYFDIIIRSRSRINVVFKLPPEHEKDFFVEAKKEGFIGLEGHRSVVPFIK